MGKKLRYTIPNSFTALSLLLGTGAIVTGQLGNLELACWMIVWCGLLDVMDDGNAVGVIGGAVFYAILQRFDVCNFD